MIDLQNIAYVIAIFAALFLTSELLGKIFTVKSEWTRKLVHISTGAIAISFPYIFNGLNSVLVLCSSFVLMLGLIEKFKLLGSITGINRKSYGSILFPISVMMCFICYHQTGSLLNYVLPISILTISDPLAAIVGQKLNSRQYSFFGNRKTYLGSFVFFVSSVVVSFLVFDRLGLPVRPANLFVLGAISCIAEAISNRGTDNFNIPLAVLIVLYFQEMLNSPIHLTA